MYLTMQFAQIKQSVYRVQSIWSNSLQYSSPVFLSSSGIRPIGFVNKSNMTRNPYDRLKKNAQKQVAAYFPLFFLLSD